MKFCEDEECGGMLVSEKHEGEKVMECRSCGKIHDTEGESLKITEEKEEDPMDRLNVSKSEDEETLRATTEKECPNCSSDKEDEKEHEWWMEQTRASDEPPTRFYECTECGNVHKEYD
ncbi:MAG: RPA12/RPB9/RPC11 RNA polymerase family protein [Candidatus Nanohaloarchaea archaeon]